MKIKKIITYLIILLPLLTFSQVHISGKVMDQYKEPVVFANVILSDVSNKKIIKGGITDSKGEFIIEIPKGFYELQVSFLGYKTWKDSLNIKNNVNLRDIRLLEDATALSEIVVEGRKPMIERKIDRTVFNVSKSTVSIGGDGLDALRVTPGIRISNSDVQIVGKGNVRVLVNDRLMNLSGGELFDYIRSIPADNIERIEIITNPPAKYDAEGNTGLINIVTKKRMSNGFYGTVTGRLTKATNLSKGLSSNFNYNSKKLNINASISFNKFKPAGYYALDVFYPLYTLNEKNDYSSNINSFGENINLSYNITKTTTIGTNIHINDSDINNGRDDRSNFIKNKEIDSILITQNKDDIKANNKRYALYIDHKIDSLGSKATFEASYLDYKQNRNYQFITKNFDSDKDLIEEKDPVSSINSRKINLLYALVDVTLNSELATFKFGSKASFSKTDNDSEYNNSNIVNANNSHFKYDENVYASYLSVNKKLNKWSFKGGLRAEYTSTEGNSLSTGQVIKNDYTKLFPTAYIKYDLNDNHTFSATYGRRINRPNFKALDPYREYYSTFAYREGNPYLEPSYSDNYELIHNYKGKFITSLYMNYVTNGYDYITVSESNSPTIATISDNFLTSYSYGISENISFSLFHWLESNNQLQAYYSEIFSTNSNTRDYSKGYGAYVYSNNSIVFYKKKSIKGNFIFWYQFPEVYGVDEWESYYGINIGLSGRFFDDRLTLAMNLSDLLKTAGYSYDSDINGIPQTYSMYNDTRNIRFSMTYRFGTKKNKKTSRQVNDENSNRVN